MTLPGKDTYVAVAQCFIQCVSVIHCFTPIAQPAAGLTPEANKRKHDRNRVSQNCSKTTTVSMLSETWVIACLWVGVTWQRAGWQQWLVYHLSPAEPRRPYVQTEGAWATEPWSCGQLLGPNCRTIWRWIICVFRKELWTPLAWFSGMLTRIDNLTLNSVGRL